MKKLILILLLGFIGLCFADTARLQKMVEVFLEKGSYVKVVGGKVKYYPRNSITYIEIETDENIREGKSDVIDIWYLDDDYSHGLTSRLEILFDTYQNITQDADGNIIVTNK